MIGTSSGLFNFEGRSAPTLRAIPRQYPTTRLALCRRRSTATSVNTTKNLKPFVWTADPDCIIENVNRGYQAIALDH
jgi:hypothetical protein